MPLLDFDYLIVSNECYDESSLRDTIEFFHGIGIRKFIFTVSFDRSKHTVGWILDRMGRLRETLRHCHSRGISVALYASIEQSEGIVYDVGLLRLSIKRSPYIFMKLPNFVDDPFVESDLNYFCFKRKCRPIFTAFEDNIRTNSPEMIQRLMSSRLYQFALDLNYLTSLDAEPQMLLAIENGVALLPSITHSLDNYPGVFKRMVEFRNSIGVSNYTKFCRTLQASGHRLFTKQ
ncbi:MAG: hypothetical protein IJY47_01655 [Clostridia bacterium]|nr:hypothetical protein [Clostridia bacterium]